MLLARLDLEGIVRTRENFDRVELEAELDGRNVRPGGDLAALLVRTQAAGEGTLVAPLLARLREHLGAQMQASSLAAHFTVRRTGGNLGVVVPEARLRGSNGESLVLLSRAQLRFTEAGVPLFSGNFSTGGAGLPQVAGRMEQDAGGAIALQMRMAEYAAGDARLSVPELSVRQAPDGALAIAGRINATGA